MDFILSLEAISHLVSKAKEIKVNRIFRNSPRINHPSDIIISTELIEGASFYKYVDMSMMPIRLLSDSLLCNHRSETLVSHLVFSLGPPVS